MSEKILVIIAALAVSNGAAIVIALACALYARRVLDTVARADPNLPLGDAFGVPRLPARDPHAEPYGDVPHPDFFPPPGFPGGDDGVIERVQNVPPAFGVTTLPSGGKIVRRSAR